MTKGFESIQLNTLDEERLMITAALPIMSDGPQAAIWTSVDTWFLEDLEEALGVELEDYCSTVIIPFAAEEGARAAVRRWQDAEWITDATWINLYVPDSSQSEQTWTCESSGMIEIAKV